MTTSQPLKPRRSSARSRMSLSGTGSNGLPLGGSSMTTKTSASLQTKENKSIEKEDLMKQVKQKVTTKKRAASVGGQELQSLLKESQNQLSNSATNSTSRKNAPAPRKSSIRQVPQIFQSPTGLIPSPESRKGLPPISSMTEVIPPFNVKARDATMTISKPSFAATEDLPARNCVTQVIRPKRARRVTFSTRQEKTEFAKDEPTLRLGSLRREMPPMTPTSTQGSSSTGLSFHQSDSDSESDSDPESLSEASDDDMAMSMVTASDRLPPPTSSSNPSADSSTDMSMDLSGDNHSEMGGEQNATVSMEMTTAHGMIRKRRASDMDNDLHSCSESDDENDESMDQSGMMDLTEAVGSAPLLKRRSSVAQMAADRAAEMDNDATNEITLSKGGYLLTHTQGGETSDTSDMSISRQDESEIQQDQTVTMEFTTALPSVINKQVRGSSKKLSFASNDGSEKAEFSDADDDAMDMTKAVTTVIRTKGNQTATQHLPQQGTEIMTQDYETESDDDENEEGEEDEDEREDLALEDESVPMNMTKAVTGLIRQKDSHGPDEALKEEAESEHQDQEESRDIDNDATVASTMEMTMAMGSILSKKSPEKKTLLSSPSKTSSPAKNTSPKKAPSRTASPVKSPAKSSPKKKSPAHNSPVKSIPVHVSPVKRPTEDASPENSMCDTPSRFRQSLKGGIHSSSYVHSPARRVGGSLPPPGIVPPQEPASNFRHSLIGGVASPAYKHSAPRRQTTSVIPDALTTPQKPKESFLMKAAGLSMSAKKQSPSPNTKAAKQALMSKSRKSLGSNLISSTGYKPSSISATGTLSRTAPRPSSVTSLFPGYVPDEDPVAEEEEQKMEEDAMEENEAAANEMDSRSDTGLEDSFTEDAPIRMPLDEFLSFVGVQFHDDMNASRRRPVPPAKEGEVDANLSTDSEVLTRGGPVSMMRLVKAACGAVPQLQALREACREIKEQVDDGREKMVEMEQAFYDNPPDFVKEIMGLDNEEEKKDMGAQFKLQKQAARALVCADYYGWRLDKEFDKSMIETLQAYHARLECDLQIVVTKRDELRNELLPVLRQKHTQLSHDLDMARKRQSEIEECDVDELKGLYASIEEQHDVLESMRNKLKEVNEQHQRLLAKVQENREKMAVAQDMIDRAHATCEQIKGCTKGEAKRLLREIRNLEKLHLVRMVDGGNRNDLEQAQKGDEKDQTVNLVLDGWLHISMVVDLGNGAKVKSLLMRQSNVDNGSDRDASGGNLVRKLAVKILQDEFQRENPEDGMTVLRRISKTLIRQRHLLAEIEHLRCRFPVELVAPSNEAGHTTIITEVSLQASVLLPRKRSKIIITAQSDLQGMGETKSILLTDSVKVEKIYGSVDANAMSLQILDCLEADPTIGSLSKAFIETVDTFDS